MHENQQRTVQLVGKIHGVASGKDRQEGDGTGRRGSVEQTARQLKQENVGENVPCAKRMHVSESSERRESSEDGMQWEEVEEIDDGARRKREDSNSLENVGVAGNVAQRCERSAAVSLDEIGKNYEKLKTTVITRSSDKAEQSRRPTLQDSWMGPMDVENVSGSEKDDEDSGDVDEIRRSMSSSCGDCQGPSRKGRRQAQRDRWAKRVHQWQRQGGQRRDGGTLSGCKGGAPEESKARG